MHIPNGFIDGPTAITTAAASIGFLAYAAKKTKDYLKQKYIPLIGVTAAFIFAAQMLNFPIAAGTSGHFMGAAFAVVVAGPFGGSIIMALVVALQCLIFQDGGLTALGANILNMAVIGPVCAYFLIALFKVLGKNNRWLTNAGIFIAAATSIVVASAAASVELAASGTADLKIILPSMTGIHLFIGLVEGTITVGAIAIISRLKPDIFENKGSNLRPAAVSLIILCLVALLFVPLASNFPDGLEKVAMLKGFESKAIEPAVKTMFYDYTVPFTGGSLSSILAGIIGTAAVVMVALGSLMVLRGSKS